MRSLLTWLELAIGRRVRRLGLSATLGDMDLAKAYLHPESPAAVELLEAKGSESELLLQLRGYISGDEDETKPSAAQRIAQHLFKNLRGSDNLIFAGSRQNVEIYADQPRSSPASMTGCTTTAPAPRPNHRSARPWPTSPDTATASAAS